MTILAIARNTFKECVRDKVLYNLLLFAILIISSSLILGTITIGDVKQIIINLGLSTLSVFGTLIAIFIGITLVYKEIDKKTVYSLLSKPVNRQEFLLGKYFGLVMTLAVNISVMVVVIFAAIVYLRGTIQLQDLQILLAGLVILVGLMLVVAIALFFSTFSTPVFSALFTFSLYVIGHFNADIRNYGLMSKSPFVHSLSSICYYAMPNFDNFQIISRTSHGQIVESTACLFSMLYGLAYSAGLLLLSMVIFQQRDFK